MVLYTACNLVIKIAQISIKTLACSMYSGLRIRDFVFLPTFVTSIILCILFPLITLKFASHPTHTPPPVVNKNRQFADFVIEEFPLKNHVIYMDDVTFSTSVTVRPTQ